MIEKRLHPKEQPLNIKYKPYTQTQFLLPYRQGNFQAQRISANRLRKRRLDTPYRTVSKVLPACLLHLRHAVRDHRGTARFYPR